MEYKGIVFKDWPEQWTEHASRALDWLEQKGLLVPCRVNFKPRSKTKHYGEYFGAWNSISIYNHPHEHVDALLVHEFIHAWQEVHGNPSYDIEFPPPKTTYDKYILSASEFHAYTEEHKFRVEQGYPVSQVVEDYLEYGIDLRRYV